MVAPCPTQLSGSTRRYVESEELGIEDEKYLSAATLARLKELTFEEDEATLVPEAAPAMESLEAVDEAESETATAALSVERPAEEVVDEPAASMEEQEA